MNIAHENYFYGIKELSKLERHIIHEMTIKCVTGRQREVNKGWLNLYCAPLIWRMKWFAFTLQWVFLLTVLK